MKIFVIAVLAVVLMASVAMADQTGRTFWHSHSYTDADSYVDRYSEFEKKQGIEVGLGYDVIVYEFEGDAITWGLDAVEVQQKYDINNKDYSAYVVVKANAWRPLKKLIGR